MLIGSGSGSGSDLHEVKNSMSQVCFPQKICSYCLGQCDQQCPAVNYQLWNSGKQHGGDIRFIWRLGSITKHVGYVVPISNFFAYDKKLFNNDKNKTQNFWT